MQLILVIIHIVVCITLIMIVLLQKGKGADLGAAFGSGSSQTIFGSRGASSFIQKVTIIAAVVFMLTSLGLAFQFGRGRAPSSIMEEATQAPVSQPAQGSGGQSK